MTLAGVIGRSMAHNRAGRAASTIPVEDYGLLSPDYQHIAAPKLVELLRAVEN